MDKILEQTLLFDFYGELLTEHQKEIYGQFLQDDFSLSEIAEERGISRQGVHDLIRRCSRTLTEYEAKLHLVEKFISIREKVHRIDSLLEDCGEDNTKEVLGEIRNISAEIIEEL